MANCGPSYSGFKWVDTALPICVVAPIRRTGIGVVDVVVVIVLPLLCSRICVSSGLLRQRAGTVCCLRKKIPGFF